MKPNLFSMIPSGVRYDKRLKANAKLLYGEITALTSAEGYCWAGNEYFANLYEVDHKTISRWISQLRDFGYIEVEILQNEGNKRRITIDKIITTSLQKSHEVVTKKSRGSDEKVTPIYENNTINNTKNREKEALAFLEHNFPSQYEAFLMKFQTRLGADFEAFKTDFNNKAVIELGTGKLVWERDPLFARASNLAENWIRNREKINKPAAVQHDVVPGPKRNVFKG